MPFAHDNKICGKVPARHIRVSVELTEKMIKYLLERLIVIVFPDGGSIDRAGVSGKRESSTLRDIGGREFVHFLDEFHHRVVPVHLICKYFSQPSFECFIGKSVLHKNEAFGLWSESWSTKKVTFSGNCYFTASISEEVEKENVLESSTLGFGRTGIGATSLKTLSILVCVFFLEVRWGGSGLTPSEGSSS